MYLFSFFLLFSPFAACIFDPPQTFLSLISSSSQPTHSQSIDDLNQELNDGVRKISANPNLDRTGIAALAAELQSKMDKNLKELQKEQEKQKLAEEVRES